MTTNAEKPSVTWIRQNVELIWEKWIDEKCPGTWPDYLADALQHAQLGDKMINNKRETLRGYIRTQLLIMTQAEMEDEDERLLAVAKNIEHLARELREHAELNGL